MAKADAQPLTLESLVSRFRRSANDRSLQGGNVELEVRYDSVKYPVFETVLDGLVAKKIDVDDGEIQQTINAIVTEKGKTALAGGKALNRIRQITFDHGVATGEKYSTKENLLGPFWVKSPFSLSYKVALSLEREDGKFVNDANSEIRVKLRASFLFRGAGPSPVWRFDLTIVRQVLGEDAGEVKNIAHEMFRAHRTTPATMLDDLGLRDPHSVKRDLYRYEIEIEHVDPSPEGRDRLTPSAITGIAEEILRIANPDYLEEAVYQSEVYKVAQLVIKAPGTLRRFEREWGLKKLAPQVVALTRAAYAKIYPPLGYYLTDKADGIRAIATGVGARLAVLGDRLYEFSAASADSPRVVVDGELLPGGADAPPTFLGFDVIALGDQVVADLPFEDRVRRLPEAIALLEKYGVKARGKTYEHLTSTDPKHLEKQFRAIEQAPRPYEIDGLILVKPGRPYAETKSLKWKDLAHTTIDFLARRAPRSVLGKPPFTDSQDGGGRELYFLFVGVAADLFDALGLVRCPGYSELFPAIKDTGYNRGSYFPIQFAPSDVPYAYLYWHPKDSEFGPVDGKVIELRCSGPCLAASGGHQLPTWAMVKIREDRERELKAQRYFGNDFKVAESTWLNYVDPLPRDQLYLGPEESYFAQTSSGIYKPQRAYTSFVKTRWIETLKHSKWVVDLASGQGQDLGRYMNAHVQNLVAVDQDRAALAELVRRKYSHSKNRREASRGTRVHVLVADLSRPSQETLDEVQEIPGFPGEGADAVVCNLAVHYFAGTNDALANFVVLCRGLVRVGGSVILSTMFGSKVLDLLAREQIPQGQAWQSEQDGILKYAIERRYSGTRLTKAGQTIGVLLPFSDGRLYEEFLVNVGHLADEFRRRGFRLESTPSFQDYAKEFATRNAVVDAKLTDADRQYLGLYGVIHLRREK